MTCNIARAFVSGSTICCPWVPASTHREAFQTPLECIPYIHSDLWKVMLLKKMERGVTTSYILTVPGLFPNTRAFRSLIKNKFERHHWTLLQGILKLYSFPCCHMECDIEEEGTVWTIKLVFWLDRNIKIFLFFPGHFDFGLGKVLWFQQCRLKHFEVKRWKQSWNCAF